MKKSSFKFSWEDTLLEMLPSRALFLPETKELLICDIHLGKAEYFQQNVYLLLIIQIKTISQE